MSLKSGLRVIQGHWKWRHSIDRMRLSISLPSYHFPDIWRSTYSDFEIYAWSLKVIGNGTINRSHTTIRVPICIVIMAVSCTVFELERDIGQKTPFFHCPLYLTCTNIEPLRIFAQNSNKKVSMCCGAKILPKSSSLCLGWLSPAHFLDWTGVGCTTASLKI